MEDPPEDPLEDPPQDPLEDPPDDPQRATQQDSKTARQPGRKTASWRQCWGLGRLQGWSGAVRCSAVRVLR